MFPGYAPEKIEYGIKRYQNETRRLYHVMETQLAKTNAYLVGDKCTIADLSCWGWVAAHRKCCLLSPPTGQGDTFADTRCREKDWAGLDIEDLPNLKAWMERILERPGSEKGRHVPTKHTALETKNLSQEQIEKSAAEARKWVQQGMAADAQK